FPKPRRLLVWFESSPWSTTICANSTAPEPPQPRSTTTIPRRIRGDPMTTAPTHGHPTEQSAALFARAEAVTPGGVNSPVRAFKAVGGTPRFITEATGAWLRDADGNDYIDLIGS